MKEYEDIENKFFDDMNHILISFTDKISIITEDQMSSITFLKGCFDVQQFYSELQIPISLSNQPLSCISYIKYDLPILTFDILDSSNRSKFFLDDHQYYLGTVLEDYFSDFSAFQDNHLSVFQNDEVLIYDSDSSFSLVLKKHHCGYVPTTILSISSTPCDPIFLDSFFD